jgi:hypothetical protein
MLDRVRVPATCEDLTAPLLVGDFTDFRFWPFPDLGKCLT